MFRNNIIHHSNHLFCFTKFDFHRTAERIWFCFSCIPVEQPKLLHTAQGFLRTLKDKTKFYFPDFAKESLKGQKINDLRHTIYLIFSFLFRIHTIYQKALLYHNEENNGGAPVDLCSKHKYTIWKSK
jgi:hypothetical protein